MRRSKTINSTADAPEFVHFLEESEQFSHVDTNPEIDEYGMTVSCRYINGKAAEIFLPWDNSLVDTGEGFTIYYSEKEEF